MSTGNKKIPELAARCGLYCGACSLYLGTVEGDNSKIAMVARFLDQSVEDTKCRGCRSDNVSRHCKSCNFKTCNEEKNVSFCGECPEYPCKDFKDFKDERPHRMDIENDMRKILDLGADEWIKIIKERYACPECGTVNSAYDIRCRVCSHEPSSEYVKEYSEIIKKYLNV